MKKFAVSLLAAPLVLFSGAALAGDVEAGKAKADALYCMDCHAGEDFEGMSLQEIIDANKAVLAGDQPHPPGLEDMTKDDIPDLSAYFYAISKGE